MGLFGRDDKDQKEPAKDPLKDYRPENRTAFEPKTEPRVPPAPLERLRLRVAELPSYALGFGLAAVVALVGATVPSQGVPPFIYFQF